MAGEISVFDFIQSNDAVDNMGVINGEVAVNDTDVMLEPIPGSYEALQTALSSNAGMLRLRIKGTDRYVYLTCVAKADWS